MTQATALSILKAGGNVFLTGEPGSGKTYLVNAYIRYLRDHDIRVAITASTGIAATHIGGSTIHSWSGIGIRTALSAHDVETIANTDRLAKQIQNTHVLIIDEISMLDASTLDMVEQVCRATRKSAAPFGGLQVILVGDFFQLPPVSKHGDAPAQFAFTAAS
jgi:ATP-dependent exoDNAse (exonuclease V) alpha subunit